MIPSSAVLFVLALCSVHQAEGHFFKKSKGVPTPLFGRILYGHPVPGAYSVPTPLSGYGPHYPVRAIALPPAGKHAKGPVYIPPPPPVYPLSPPPTIYHPPPYPTPAYPAYPSYPPPYAPPAYSEPAYEPPSYPAPAYEPPSYPAPAYEPPSYPAPYKSPAYETPAYPAPAHPAPAYPQPVQPSYPDSEYATQPPATTPAYTESNNGYPVPSTFDNTPWKPMPAEPLPYNEQPAQLIEADGYPWTPELESDPQSEAVKDKIPEVIFYPEKPIALVHSSVNDVEFNPNPARVPGIETPLGTESPLDQ